MRILKVNGQILDTDANTAIGVTFQAMDLKDPGKRKVKYTNTFTVPKTANNMRIFGNPGDPQSIDLLIYNSQRFDYWEDNLYIIEGGKVRVEEVSDRISLFATGVTDIWEDLKLYKTSDFFTDLFNWLNIPKKETPILDTFANFLYPYTVALEGIYLPFFFSNLYGLERNEGLGDYIEDTSSLWLKYGGSKHGGHFCIYYKTIFQFLEYKYNVKFLTEGGILPGNIWDDPIASKFYHTFRSLDVGFNYSGSNITGFYFRMASRYNFAPHEDVAEMSDKSAYDIINCFFQYFNILIDEIDLAGEKVTRLARWDDLTNAHVVDWSSKLTGTYKFSPKIDGYTQANTIKFSNVYEGGIETINSKVLTSLNKNLDAKSDLFSINCYIPGSIPIDNSYIPDLSTEDSFETNVCFINSGLLRRVNVFAGDGITSVGASLVLNIPAIYSLDGEYRLLDSIIKYPKKYEIQKYLTLTDIIDIQFFKQYYIRELGASFFINKISGFNPNTPNKATTIELIKISEQTPIYPAGLEYYTDGIGDGWTDGINDYYY